MTENLHLKNQNFVLHPEGVLFWEERAMLMIADVHLGKSTHFRKNGLPVPISVTKKNYTRLDKTVLYFNPKTICFLGDLFHSHLNKEWTLFETWVKKQTAKIILVTGNHDIISPHKFESLNIALAAELLLDSFLLTHHPVETAPDIFNFCGHIHPGIQLKGEGKQVLKLPCFFKSEKQLILPAFGDFTGNFTLMPKKEDQIFVITPEEVILVST
ncbi:ligase-associated DNA damage response endonuclease PdeM [Ascidiimonas sp. W6]|uniref:ligase-associated DNA damage response endonuclease PdeM n=1 Tax=Ascidiimonas meishanensis TaxID=3128903 RepID=UPI0030EF7F40